MIEMAACESYVEIVNRSPGRSGKRLAEIWNPKIGYLGDIIPAFPKGVTCFCEYLFEKVGNLMAVTVRKHEPVGDGVWKGEVEEHHQTRIDGSKFSLRVLVDDFFERIK